MSHFVKKIEDMTQEKLLKLAETSSRKTTSKRKTKKNTR